MRDAEFRVRPVTLSNDHVRLEPLRPAHAPDLFHAGHVHPSLEFQPTPPFERTVNAVSWVTGALDAHLAGTRLPFAIIDPREDVAVGSAKLLLLTHCFETLGCDRVQLKTDARNLVSQRAIERLGATREGVLRRHQKLPDGFVRDTVFYSILPDEWPAIKTRLSARLAV